MKELHTKFLLLDANEKKKAHIKACTYSLAAWDAFTEKGKNLSYRDSVALMKHQIENDLPGKALQAVIEGLASKEIEECYLEPITALQDMDWEPPENIEYAFYSIYNLFRKYCEGAEIDDWLIINQSLSSETDENKWNTMFLSILS
jgi:hypothetical protein